jgi:hypothetical protein
MHELSLADGIVRLVQDASSYGSCTFKPVVGVATLEPLVCLEVADTRCRRSRSITVIGGGAA